MDAPILLALSVGRFRKGNLSKNALGKRTQWMWTLDTNKAAVFLKTVSPYLVTKRNHAIAALAYYRTDDEHKKSDFAAMLLVLNG